MRLHRLTLRHVRGVDDRCVTFAPDGDTTGVIIVEGCNEAGKSTLGDALDALLDHKDSSKNSDVRSLKSAGRDEAPEVEAELEIGDHRFVYRKRFLKQPITELRITAPTKENVTGEAAHARVQQILNDQVDVGLWSSLRLRQGNGIEQAGPGGAHGLAIALSAHSDASAIGDRELAVLDAVRTEYERYYTAKSGAERPLLKDAASDVEQHRQVLADLDERRTQLDGHVDTAQRLERALPDLRAQVTDTAQRADELAARRQEIDGLRARVADCTRDESAALKELDHLEERRHRRLVLVTELDKTETEHTDITGALTEAESAQREAAVRLERAQQDLDDAKERLRAARADRGRAQHDLDHLQDRAALDSLTARWDRATAAIEQLRQASADAAAIAVDQALLDELHAAETKLTRADAALQAASPELRFTAAQAVALEVAGQTVELDAGATEQWSVNGTLTMRIGDIGEVEIRSGAGTEEATEARRVAAERLAQALETGGVDDVAAAEAAFRRLRDCDRAADDACRERDLALDGTTLEALDDDIDRIRRQVDAYVDGRDDSTPLPTDATAARVLLADVVETERLAEEAVSTPEAAVELARTQVAKHRDEVVELRTRAEETKRRAESLRQELDDERTTCADADLDDQIEQATGRCDRLRAELQDAQDALVGADPDTVTTLADNAAAVAVDARTRLQATEQELRDTRVRIATLGGDGLWEQREEAASRLAHAENELAGLRRRAAAARTLLTTMERHRDEARDRYATPLREQLVSYGRMLHGPDFDIELDDDLRVARRHLDGVTLDIDQLSIGAQEQLSLLGRLACATLLGEAGGLLLFDDALGNTDPERLERIGAVLRLAGEHCQVVVLTCYPDRYRHVGGATRITL